MRSLRLLLLPTLAVSLASAQTASTAARKPAAATHSAAHTAATAHSTAGACVKVPELSAKIPALPPGSPCPKALYTITSTPTAHLEGVSPLESAGLADYLGIEPSTFTLAYVDTKVGEGPVAGPHQYYTIHYSGYLVDGTKFDSSYDHHPADPITIPYGNRQVIPGWDTGFAGMRVGGRRRLFIPYQLAYGANGRPPQIPAKAELVFDVELISVSDNPPPPPPSAAKPPTPPPAARPGMGSNVPNPNPPAAAPAQTTAPAANPAKP